MALLEVENITKHFGETQVLMGIDFRMDKGEVLAIIGSSGSGKTTLLRCLNFLETPDSGIITVGGEEVFSAGAEYSEKELREKRLKFGMVFQGFNLFPQYTVKKNVMLAAELRLKEQCRAAGKRNPDKEQLDVLADRAMELLSTVGLSEKSEFYPCQLSGGQQQRVAIARALMLSPEILCFDEPTSALDPELTVEVLRVIKSLKEMGSTMIVVTHEMEFAKNVADHIIYMKDGVIAAEGAPGDIFHNPQNEALAQFLNNGL